MPRLSKIGAAALAAFGWTGLSSVSASYVVVAGGGGANTVRGGGGGAGGILSGTVALNPLLSYTIVIGAGGTGVLNGQSTVAGTNGANSTFSALATAAVGGGASGASGGSGGGGGGFAGSTGGAGTSGQGFAGGNGTNYGAGGGGGAGAVGGTGTLYVAGNGGTGIANPITGSTSGQLVSSTYYLGGGGGGGHQSNLSGTRGLGGNGGGGNGGLDGSTVGIDGLPNTGGGGGGGGGDGANYFKSGFGGSGIVIISYPSPQKFGGGVVTTSGANTIHTFNTSGTLAPLSTLTANFLVVAGGGSGADYGGGGAGGLRSTVTNTGGGGSLESALTIDTNSTYLVTVGAGGTGGIVGANGSDSTFLSITSTGGGRGANNTTPTVNGSSGGSGGGGRWTGGTGGAGTTNQGFAGGSGGAVTSSYPAGGGGGASAVGGNGTSGGNGGNGGAGVAVSISGTSTTYAGGGGGGCAPDPSGVGGSGGSGGGGTGGTSGSGQTAGTANTGSGGGGAGTTGGSGGSGGSGIVIISYAGSTQQMAGGTVTISGGNVIHTFNSSGYLTPLKLVNNSLRFRSSNSAYLYRTPNQTSNRKTWTWSAWVKRGTLGSAYYPALFMGGTTNTNQGITGITFNADTISVGGYFNYWRVTSQVFRDPAAWYHVVVALDTTQAVANNRLLIYVNGVQVTAFATNNTITQNDDLGINQAQTHVIGYQSTSYGSSYFDGEMTEVNFIDGQALTPNSFGSFNQYGVWQPITYGGSYGTNGFYLPFTTNNSSTSYAGSFNGSSQYLYLGGQSNFAFGTGDFTVEFWVNENSLNTPIIYDSRPSSVDGAYPTIYINASGNIAYYTNSAVVITSATVMVPYTWYHVALVRSGTTTTLYLNGVSQGTYNDTTNYLNSTLSRPTIGCGYTGVNVLDGYLSNLRVVKGTAVYTSNFTPSTTPLTAITNTQLLTLQNATIVDNSTNAFTINNNNAVTTGKTYPFAINIFKDQGPSGNNWTPINISGGFGSTLDYMTDVPTLTSATAANYAVLNPTIPNTTNLTNGNLTRSGSVRTNVSTAAVIAGKYYFETTIQDSNGNGGVGVKQTTAYPIESYETSKCASYFANGEYKIEGAAQTSGFSSYTNGDVISCAVDSTVSPAKIWWAKNGTWQGTGNPTTAGYSLTAGLTYYFMVLHGSGSSSTAASVNFGQQPFAYTIPSGYTALNTYNL